MLTFLRHSLRPVVVSSPQPAAGQTDQYDFHSVGLDFETLAAFLGQAGFCEIRRLKRGFELFDDGSQMQHLGQFISVNIHARACKPGNRVDVNFDNAGSKDRYYSEAEMATTGR